MVRDRLEWILAGVPVRLRIRAVWRQRGAPEGFDDPDTSQCVLNSARNMEDCEPDRVAAGRLCQWQGLNIKILSRQSM